ncbi:MAG: aminopeptidase, partial [Gammaproteobacteria bacterium]
MMLDLPVRDNLTRTADLKALLKLSHIILLVSCILSSACTSFGYYSQAVSGQIEIIMKQRPITDVIRDESTEPSVRQKLAEITDILDFAHSELGLP